jgi:hypothetical protein
MHYPISLAQTMHTACIPEHPKEYNMADTMIRLEGMLRRRQRRQAIRQALHVIGAVALITAALYFWWN